MGQVNKSEIDVHGQHKKRDFWNVRPCPYNMVLYLCIYIALGQASLHLAPDIMLRRMTEGDGCKRLRKRYYSFQVVFPGASSR